MTVTASSFRNLRPHWTHSGLYTTVRRGVFPSLCVQGSLLPPLAMWFGYFAVCNVIPVWIVLGNQRGCYLFRVTKIVIGSNPKDVRIVQSPTRSQVQKQRPTRDQNGPPRWGFKQVHEGRHDFFLVTSMTKEIKQHDGVLNQWTKQAHYAGKHGCAGFPPA